jgi:hypothetical protein
MSIAANAALVEPWKELWNGDLSITETTADLGKVPLEPWRSRAVPVTGQTGG